MVIANAMLLQVATANKALATLAGVKQHPHQPYRKRRLAALLARPEFGGVKAALGKALGYDSGAFVSQMLSGHRPITETVVQRIEAVSNGKYRGWFSAPDDGPDEPEVYGVTEEMKYTPRALEVARKYDLLKPEARKKIEMHLESLLVNVELI